MIITKLQILILLSFSLLLFGSLGSSCAKEYSFEGRTIDTTVLDTVPIDRTTGMEGCNACLAGELKDWEWSFLIGAERFCGKADTAIMNVEKNAFTFFGPSQCSQDSGMIITAHFSDHVLNRDHQQITTSRGDFYYYDNVKNTFVLISKAGVGFHLVIDNYVHSSGLAIGRFNVVTNTTDNKNFEVKSGKFRVYLK